MFGATSHLHAGNFSLVFCVSWRNFNEILPIQLLLYDTCRYRGRTLRCHLTIGHSKWPAWPVYSQELIETNKVKFVTIHLVNEEIETGLLEPLSLMRAPVHRALYGWSWIVYHVMNLHLLSIECIISQISWFSYHRILRNAVNAHTMTTSYKNASFTLRNGDVTLDEWPGASELTGGDCSKFRWLRKHCWEKCRQLLPVTVKELLGTSRVSGECYVYIIDLGYSRWTIRKGYWNYPLLMRWGRC